MRVKAVHKKEHGLSVGAVLALPVVLAVVIGAFSFANDEELQHLLSQSKGAKKTLTSLEQYREFGNGNGGTISIGNDATTGTGLNLLLINNIQTECFVKEYLSIARENQEGKLGAKDGEYEVYVGVGTIIGKNISETGTYKCGLPTTDLPEGADGAPVWDSQTHSLYLWNKNSSPHNTEVGGPLAYTADNRTWTGIAGKSKYNTGTSTSGDGGDGYLFPDAVYGLNSFLKNGLSAAGLSASVVEDKDGVVSAVAAIAHNRGAGGMYMLYGVDYSQIMAGKASSYVTPNQEDSIKILEGLVEDVTAKNELAGEVSKRVGGYRHYDWMNPIFLYGQGWYFTQDAVSFMQQYSSDGMVNLWNVLYPNDACNSNSAVLAKIQSRVKSVNEVLGISASECDRVYGTVGGQPQVWSGWSNKYYCFKVWDFESTAYKAGGSHKLVTCLDTNAMLAVRNSIYSAGYLYAFMLKYAGVDVDPTNPDTYTQKYMEAGEWTAGFSSVSGNLMEDLVAHGLDQDGLTEDRLKVVVQGAKLCAAGNVRYHNCRGTGCMPVSGYCDEGRPRCDGKCYWYTEGLPTHLDCSATIYWCFLTGIGERGIAINTGSYAGNSKVKRLGTDWSRAKPGDIAWKPGHVRLVIGVKGSAIYTIETNSHGKCVRYTDMTISYANSNGYCVYRYTGF